VLTVAGLTKTFGKRRAVDGLSFEVAAGELLGLLGPNGAGKTTSFLCLSGLVRPDGGTIELFGRKLGSNRGRELALIPESPEVYAMLTVWEHLAFVARAARLGAGWEARASDLLERLGLAEASNKLGQELSKGMKQKTLIASTLLLESPVIMLDEPMIGLDPKGQRELRELLSELKARGTSILMSTHLIESAESICDRVIIMKDGRAIAGGLTSQMHDRAAGGRTLEDVFLEITA
jgi:ABC-type multidrug transport system ATPase subunit